MAERRRAVDTGPQNIEQTRFVFFPGNVIAEDRSRELMELERYRIGGIEVDSPTLCAVPGWENFVARCRITPVLTYGDPLPRQLMAEGERAVVLDRAPAPALPDTATAYISGGSVAAPVINGVQVCVGVRAYPGEHIPFITEQGFQSRRGVYELASLFRVKMEWEEFAASGIQEEFFPNLHALPKTLREVEATIQSVQARKHGLEREIAGEMLQSCGIFRLWATQHLDKIDQAVQAGRNDAGFAHTYSSLDLVLLEQLERERVDQHLRNQASSQMTMAQAMQMMAENNAKQAEVAAQMAQNMKVNQDLLSAGLNRTFAPAPEPNDEPSGIQSPSAEDKRPKTGIRSR